MDLSKILSLALTLIIAAEQAIPQSGLGNTKKQIVLNGVQAVLAATSATAKVLGKEDVSTITSLASGFIDSTVSLLNKQGYFKTEKALTA
jgi:hypothetical protein